jgi:chorismate dehydratase
MTPRLGRIPYLNTEPFFADDEVRAGTVVEVPSRMIDLARLGAVDIAPLPVVAAFDHPDRFRPIGSLGIAAAGAARSVLLRSSIPFDQLSGASIGVIDETATSVRLLKVLLQFRFGVGSTAFVPLDQPADAALLIGDKALLQRRNLHTHPHELDLAAEWHVWTGLPFVFASWMAHGNVTPAACNNVLDYFSANLDINLADPSAIHRRRPDLGLSAEDVATYLRTFRYRFDDSAWAGLERFQELDARLTALERVA